MSDENSGNLWAVGTPSRTQARELTALPKPPSWWEGVTATLPKNPTPLSGYGLNFRSFGPNSAVSPISFHSIPPMLRDLLKTRQRGPTCGEVERESDAVDTAVRAKRDLNSAARRAPRSRHVPTAQLPLGADRFPFRVQLHQLRHTPIGTGVPRDGERTHTAGVRFCSGSAKC